MVNTVMTIGFHDPAVGVPRAASQKSVFLRQSSAGAKVDRLGALGVIDTAPSSGKKMKTAQDFKSASQG